ncbi:T9SS type A sorting domain-containing protein [uncultured Algibacter sp.]|uniref:T9SS type A sorting domain-containing protein n=1 Tax=uncultured Algibacter sp. TaxID=298659 RepID=UPI0026264DA2|nr:T9SS type A sorting domain-containing protein [uncultured Algibacter sp.]
MKRILLLALLLINYFGNAQNLVSNGNMEVFSSPTSTPTGWSSSSDFGDFNQNTTDFTEGASSVEFTAGFSDLMMFTTVDIPLESGKTYIIKYDYKYLGSDFDANDNIEFSFYSATAPFLHGTNIQDNNWNTVTTQFIPTETKSDFEATIRVIPAAGIGSNYKVLIDNVQVFEAAPLSTISFNLKDNINIYTSPYKQLKIDTSADIVILDIAAYSIIGQKQKLTPNTKALTNFNLSTLSSGVYILKITTNKGSLTKKILLK